MKTRVIRVGEYYYPQYKGWFGIWHTFQEDLGFCTTDLKFSYPASAVNHCRVAATSKTSKKKEHSVVWESL
jgi:hypothetical protein